MLRKMGKIQRSKRILPSLLSRPGNKRTNYKPAEKIKTCWKEVIEHKGPTAT